MNKQKIKLTALVILVLLMSVGIASAGIFGTTIKFGTTVNKGDISISSSSPNPVVTISPLAVDVIIKSTYIKSITDNLVVTVTGLNGQPIYKRYVRETIVKPGTNAVQVYFDTRGWEDGAYDVLVTFPVQKGETNIKNNLAEFEIRIPYVPKPTPVPTIVPTPVPVPVNTFDVTVTAKVPTQINVGQSLDILATVAHNRKKTVEDKLRITVTGAYPATPSDMVYSIQTYQKSKELIMAHHDTVISDESTWFNFDTTGWNPGIYHVVLTFPVIPGEINSANNVYQTDVKVVGVKQLDITDVGLTVFNFELFYDLPGVSDGAIVRGEDYYINYAIKNYGNQNEATTFIIKADATATIYSAQVLLKPGEIKTGKLLLDSSYIPFGGIECGDKYSTSLDGSHTISILKYRKHTVVGEVITEGDSNSANNKMTMYIYER